MCAAVVEWVSPAIGGAIGPCVRTVNGAIYCEVVANAVDIVSIGGIGAVEKTSSRDSVGVCLVPGCGFSRTGSDARPQKILSEIRRRTDCHA